MIKNESDEYQKKDVFIDGVQPESISCTQENKNNSKDEEQNSVSSLYLFFSFDVVNSTIYKAMTYTWPIVMKALLDDIYNRVHLNSYHDLNEPILWRVIGDELIFVVRVGNNDFLQNFVDFVFRLTQIIDRNIRNGKFFESIKNQKLTYADIKLLRVHSPLSIKTAMWVASVNDKYENEYDCIKVNYAYYDSYNKQSTLEFLGSDIDAGFRLKQYTQDRRVVISFELACLLARGYETDNEYKRLNIMGYVKLKGVWNESLYPIIWYYNSDVVKDVKDGSKDGLFEIDFENSFRYDEASRNPLVNNYFIRMEQISKNKERDLKEEYSYLSSSMFNAKEAINKIKIDRDLQGKIDYFIDLYQNPQPRKVEYFEYTLELHCAVVCCKHQDRKVMIIHRGDGHKTNPSKWEFGCAKAKSNRDLKSTIEDYYKENYNVQIKLVCDESREGNSIKPIAVYEINNNNNIKKGIIFVGKVIHDGGFRDNNSHDRVEWIGEDDVDKYGDSETVENFKQTLRKVFKEYF